MSDFNGPGAYRLIYANSPSGSPAAVEIKDGKKDDKSKAVMKGKEKSDNQIWHIVDRGDGTVSKHREYLIINRLTGLFLACEEGEKKGGRVTSNRDSPNYNRVGWNIIPTRNDSGTYLVTPFNNSKLSLTPDYYKPDTGTELTI
ncbi:hypothetical protein M409DRAFT_18207 [Zasmidium cellare ATCC 36951]|uniref:Ricin B lectin domain-containing protein n=1 Tax=Zasmidium cellare ATCC 36951 TaxID=1080233 RepID=A0A6A6D2V2_ZASCE|nr:uncharacterized protein M409DRAFT_18207 [Zasmidium cellare ATCC 36951]KAF2171976.1 hypothetical protein M409DRAFT_18207 [Zasmidium cellare ATCC 36951]